MCKRNNIDILTLQKHLERRQIGLNGKNIVFYKNNHWNIEGGLSYIT